MPPLVPMELCQGTLPIQVIDVFCRFSPILFLTLAKYLQLPTLLTQYWLKETRVFQLPWFTKVSCPVLPFLHPLFLPPNYLSSTETAISITPTSPFNHLLRDSVICRVYYSVPTLASSSRFRMTSTCPYARKS